MAGRWLMRDSDPSVGFIRSTRGRRKRTVCMNCLSSHRWQLKDSHGGSPEPCGHQL